MHPDLGAVGSPRQRVRLKILLDEEQLREGVADMAQKIAAFYGDRPLTIVAIMTGSLILLADLSRRLTMPVRVSLIQASSYRGGTESGQLWLRDDMMLDVRGRDVLVLDDIFDTGKTLSAVLGCVAQMGPNSLARRRTVAQKGPPGRRYGTRLRSLPHPRRVRSGIWLGLSRSLSQLTLPGRPRTP